MLVAENKKYEYLLEDPVYTPKKKKRPKPKLKKSTKSRCILFTTVGFIIAITILFQYAKLNIINKDILSLEKEVKEISLLNESMAGELLAREDLEEIEKIAKKELGMVEPNSNQRTVINIKNTQGEDIKNKKNVDHSTTEVALGIFNKIKEFID